MLCFQLIFRCYALLSNSTRLYINILIFDSQNCHYGICVTTIFYVSLSHIGCFLSLEQKVISFPSCSSISSGTKARYKQVNHGKHFTLVQQPLHGALLSFIDARSCWQWWKEFKCSNQPRLKISGVWTAYLCQSIKSWLAKKSPELACSMNTHFQCIT